MRSLVPKFEERFNYTIGNEDYTSEEKSLNLKENDVILSITGSGDRPLDLLIHPCTQVVSVDSNKLQNHLLRLKMTAMRELDYPAYMSFLGLDDTLEPHQRVHILNNDILPKMTDLEAKDFFSLKKGQNLVSNGIIYQGWVERTSRLLAKFTQSIVGKDRLDRLFRFDNIHEQKMYWSWLKDTYRFRLWKRLFINGVSTFRTVYGDPGLKNVHNDIDVGKYLYDSIDTMLDNRLAKESLLLSLFFKGYAMESSYPPYLRREFFDIIKSRLHKVIVVDDNVLDFMASTPLRFHKFSFSDVISYLDDDKVKDIFQNMMRCAVPNTECKVIFREFLTDQVIPTEYEALLERDTILENELDASDSCFLYRFMCAKFSVPEL